MTALSMVFSTLYQWGWVVKFLSADKLPLAVGIFLLFRPYEPRGIGRFRIQGALPKNMARLAQSIGKTVGERLLTSEDLHARLNAPAVRETFADAIGRMFDGIVDADRGSLRSHLSPTVSAAFDRALATVAPRVADRLADHLRSEEGIAQMAGWLERLREEVRDQPVTDLITPERHERIRAWVGDLATQFVEGEELEHTLRRFVATQAAALADDERPLLSRLPAGFIGAIEQAITDYIPVALDRLGALLGDPEARARIEAALRAAFDSSVRDLMLHERLLAKLMVTDRTIERLVEQAIKLGVTLFVKQPGFDKLPWNRVTASIIDKGWGSGPTTAIKLLQRMLGVADDGKIGPATIGSYNGFLNVHGEDGAAHLWAEQRIDFDTALTMNDGVNDPDKAFINGWNNRTRSFLPGTPWWNSWS